MWELHGYLRTDKSAGVFATGGPWERSLLQVANGSGNQLQLQTVWEEMRSALRQWLERQQTPGSSLSLDKASYAQAVRTFNALQRAAARGPDQLEQVPLDAVLTTQRELSALQAIIAREHAALQAKLAEAAAAGGAGAGGMDGGAAGGGGGGAALASAASLGRMSQVRGAEDDDADTEADVGSEATDMADSD